MNQSHLVSRGFSLGFVGVAALIGLLLALAPSGSLFAG